MNPSLKFEDVLRYFTFPIPSGKRLHNCGTSPCYEWGTHEINGHFQVRLNCNSHYQRVKHLKTSRNRGFTMIYPLIAWIFHFAMSTCQRWPGTSQVHGTNFLAHVTIDLAEHNSGFHGIFGKNWEILLKNRHIYGICMAYMVGGFSPPL